MTYNEFLYKLQGHNLQEHDMVKQETFQNWMD